MESTSTCHCGEKVREGTATCPGCGAPLKRRRKLVVAKPLDAETTAKPPQRNPATSSAVPASGIQIQADTSPSRHVKRGAMPATQLRLLVVLLCGMFLIAGAAGFLLLQFINADEDVVEARRPKDDANPAVGDAQQTHTGRKPAGTAAPPPTMPAPGSNQTTAPENNPATPSNPSIPDPLPPVPPTPVEVELGDPVMLHGDYSIRVPKDFAAEPVETLGTHQRWRARHIWRRTKQPKATFRVTIDYEPEYQYARQPRVSSRVPPEIDEQSPISETDGLIIVPGARIDAVHQERFTFVRAISRKTVEPGFVNAILYSAYDADRLLLVEGWCEGDFDRRTEAEFMAAAETLAREAVGPVTPPNKLVVDESKFAASLPVTTLARVDAIEGDKPIDKGIVSLAICNGGSLVAIGTAGGTVKMFDTRSGEMLETFSFRGGSIDQVFFYGTHVMGGTSHILKTTFAINLPADREIRLGYRGNRELNDDQSRMVSSWKFAVYSGTPFDGTHATLGGRRPDVSAITISADGKTIGYGSVEGDVAVWIPNTENSHHNWKNAHRGRVNHVSISPDAKRLVTSGEDTHWVVWDVENKKQIHRKPDMEIGGMKVLADGEHVVQLRGGALEKWRLTTGEMKERIELPFKASVIGFSADRKHAVVANAEGEEFGNLHVVKLEE